MPSLDAFESLMEGSPLAARAQAPPKGPKASKSRRRKRADNASQDTDGTVTISFVTNTVSSDARASAAVSTTEIRSFFQETGGGSTIGNEEVKVPKIAAQTETNAVVVDIADDVNASSTNPAGRLRRTMFRDVVLAVPEFDASQNTFDTYRGACWWDAHAFSTPCIRIPGTYDTKSKQFVQWHGAFCSWECALAYAHHTNRHRNVPMLWQLRQQVTGNMHVMHQALHFSELAYFGGTRTIEAFRCATTLTEAQSCRARA